MNEKQKRNNWLNSFPNNKKPKKYTPVNMHGTYCARLNKQVIIRKNRNVYKRGMCVTPKVDICDGCSYYNLTPDEKR